MTKTPIKVFFVYPRSSRNLGSTVMRGFQLCEIATAQSSSRFSFATKPISSLHHPALTRLWVDLQPKDAIFIFVKNAITRLDSAALQRLQRKSKLVVLDYIDRSMEQIPTDGIDVHLCSSMEQMTYLRDRVSDSENAINGTVDLLFHHADLRLHTMTFPQQHVARVAYFGGTINAFIPPSIADIVPVFDVGLSAGMVQFLQNYKDFNLHYAIRPAEQTDTIAHVFKPFTKGATAAACQSPIIVNRAAHDAEYFLGDDYPFFVDTLTETTVVETVDKAITSFGGPVWVDALERMEELNNRLHPTRIGRDLETLLEAHL